MIGNLGNLLGCNALYHIDDCMVKEEDDNFQILATQKKTRRALHVGDTMFHDFSNKISELLKGEKMQSELRSLELLIENKYKVKHVIKKHKFYIFSIQILHKIFSKGSAFNCRLAVSELLKLLY
jgi:hypothetical protein